MKTFAALTRTHSNVRLIDQCSFFPSDRIGSAVAFYSFFTAHQSLLFLYCLMSSGISQQLCMLDGDLRPSLNVLICNKFKNHDQFICLTCCEDRQAA